MPERRLWWERRGRGREMMAHFTKNTTIGVPVSRLNEIVRDPHLTPQYWAGMSAPDKVFGDGGPGTKVETSILFMGVRLRMIQRTVEERHNEDGSTDWRWTLEGGVEGWLSCHHEPRGESTETTTEFDYTLPGSVLGKVADKLLVEKRMHHDFENSLENLKLLAEASVPAGSTA
jgi:coenzyme Q-binding protein COQ10